MKNEVIDIINNANFDEEFIEFVRENFGDNYKCKFDHPYAGDMFTNPLSNVSSKEKLFASLKELVDLKKYYLSRMSYEVERFAKEWGIDDSILHKSVERFFLAREDEIPYIDEISQSINYDNANNKEAGSHLGHVMKVVNKELPEWIIKAKKKYF